MCPWASHAILAGPVKRTTGVSERGAQQVAPGSGAEFEPEDASRIFHKLEQNCG